MSNMYMYMQESGSVLVVWLACKELIEQARSLCVHIAESYVCMAEKRYICISVKAESIMEKS